MKKFVFIHAGILLMSLPTWSQQTHIITSSGNTFTPSALSVTAGDIIQFNTGSNHPVVQVSQATYNANQATPLEGGFYFPSGSGSFTAGTAGTLYYVCENHFALGMRGLITVNVSTAFNDTDMDTGKLYPVPAGDYIIYESAGREPVNEIKVMDLTGKPVIFLENPGHSSEKLRIDVSRLTRGLYIIRITAGQNQYVKKFLKS